MIWFLTWSVTSYLFCCVTAGVQTGSQQIPEGSNLLVLQMSAFSCPHSRPWICAFQILYLKNNNKKKPDPHQITSCRHFLLSPFYLPSQEGKPWGGIKCSWGAEFWSWDTAAFTSSQLLTTSPTSMEIWELPGLGSFHILCMAFSSSIVTDLSSET